MTNRNLLKITLLGTAAILTACDGVESKLDLTGEIITSEVTVRGAPAITTATDVRINIEADCTAPNINDQLPDGVILDPATLHPATGEVVIDGRVFNAVSGACLNDFVIEPDPFASPEIEILSGFYLTDPAQPGSEFEMTLTTISETPEAEPFQRAFSLSEIGIPFDPFLVTQEPPFLLVGDLILTEEPPVTGDTVAVEIMEGLAAVELVDPTLLNLRPSSERRLERYLSRVTDSLNDAIEARENGQNAGIFRDLSDATSLIDRSIRELSRTRNNPAVDAQIANLVSAYDDLVDAARALASERIEQAIADGVPEFLLGAANSAFADGEEIREAGLAQGYQVKARGRDPRVAIREYQAAWRRTP